VACHVMGVIVYIGETNMSLALSRWIVFGVVLYCDVEFV